MPKTRLLVIDDEPSIQHAFARVFAAPEYQLCAAATAEEGLEAAQKFHPHVVVLDVNLPDSIGLETLERLRRIDALVPVLLITGQGTTDLAIEAMKQGAFDYLLKPLDLAPLRELIDRAARASHLMHTPAVWADAGAATGEADVLVGVCPAMQDVHKAIGRVAATDASVLLTGESGTGKELVARAIYQHSRRADKPFLAVNCAAIPETLLDSDLFGHERGAFTGADRRRIGRFEQCTGGTIFLDEIGEMSALTQSRMLRVLQDQTFERVGGEESIRTDVRVIAATNANLEKLVALGRFRQDLYFRVKVFSIELPPLRERGADLRRLVEHFITRFSTELDRPITAIHPDVWTTLGQYDWPGNVRELQSALKQALLTVRGSVLLPEDLPVAVRSGRAAAAADAPLETHDSTPHAWEQFVAQRIAQGSQNLLGEASELMEREVLVCVLRHTLGNQLQAARILGISRGNLRAKIRALGISIERSVWSDEDQPE